MGEAVNFEDLLDTELEGIPGAAAFHGRAGLRRVA